MGVFLVIPEEGRLFIGGAVPLNYHKTLGGWEVGRVGGEVFEAIGSLSD